MTETATAPTPQQLYDDSVAALHDIVLNAADPRELMNAIQHLQLLNWGKEKIS